MRSCNSCWVATQTLGHSRMCTRMWLLLLAFIPCNSSSVTALNASASARGGGRSCDRMNSLEPWQSDAQGVMGARTTVYYAMGLHKAGTSLMGAALAARLGGGYQHEAVYFCCKQPSAACHLPHLSSATYPTVPRFFMKNIDSYFCQCGKLMVSCPRPTPNRRQSTTGPCACCMRCLLGWRCY